MLNANISRSQVFITNIVKCRPPGNRRPKRDEIIKCNDYLNKQISVINPKIVCILGATAYSSLLGGKEITLNRGKLININGRDYFLTIHPAASFVPKKFAPRLGGGHDEIVKIDCGVVMAITDDLLGAEEQLVAS